MYCKYCGSSLDENASFCTYCGKKLDESYVDTNDADKANIGFAILGFFIPLAGLIFFLYYEKKQPKRAKAAGKSALIGFIVQIVLYFTLLISSSFFIFHEMKEIESMTESYRTEDVVKAKRGTYWR